jgi:hypothetical protein
MPDDTSSRLERTIGKIDALNRRDPNTVTVDGEERPWELVHSEAMTRWIETLDPNPSEALRIAARSQHICRWKIPRDDYPDTKEGYYRWRNDLKEYHAELTGDIMAEMGYDDETIEQVQRLNRKEGVYRSDAEAEVQCIEDALSLTFMEYRLERFARKDKYSDEKVVDILTKTLNKMSEQGIETAKTLSFAPDVAPLVERAIEEL